MSYTVLKFASATHFIKLVSSMQRTITLSHFMLPISTKGMKSTAELLKGLIHTELLLNCLSTVFKKTQLYPDQLRKR
jgi:hypothetical protein